MADFQFIEMSEYKSNNSIDKSKANLHSNKTITSMQFKTGGSLLIEIKDLSKLKSKSRAKNDKIIHNIPLFEYKGREKG